VPRGFPQVSAPARAGTTRPSRLVETRFPGKENKKKIFPPPPKISTSCCNHPIPHSPYSVPIFCSPHPSPKLCLFLKRSLTSLARPPASCLSTEAPAPVHVTRSASWVRELLFVCPLRMQQRGSAGVHPLRSQHHCPAVWSPLLWLPLPPVRHHCPAVSAPSSGFPQSGACAWPCSLAAPE